MVSGSGSFISRFLPSPQHRAWAITHVEMRFRDHPGHSKGKVARSLGNSVLGPLGLCPVFFHHAGFGGATDGIYAIGLGGSADPAEHVRRAPLPPLRRSLRHFWTPSLSPRDIVVCEPPPPTRSGRDWHGHCLLHEGAARMEGLFPVSDSSITCIGPSVFHPNKSVRRCLSPDEMLRLFDVPMAVDSSLSTTRWNLARGPAPFEEALPATIWAWILCTIWGNDGGLVQFLWARLLILWGPPLLIALIVPRPTTQHLVLLLHQSPHPLQLRPLFHRLIHPSPHRPQLLYLRLFYHLPWLLLRHHTILPGFMKMSFHH